MTSNNKGLYLKYDIRRTDEKPTDGQDLFVLRLDDEAKNQEAAIAAILAYADCIRIAEPELANDIYRRYGQIPK